MLVHQVQIADVLKIAEAEKAGGRPFIDFVGWDGVRWLLQGDGRGRSILDGLLEAAYVRGQTSGGPGVVVYSAADPGREPRRRVHRPGV